MFNVPTMNLITKADIFKIHDSQDFENMCMKVFRYQAKHVDIYEEYLFHLHVNVEEVQKITDIPFLPVEFFKSRIVYDLSQGAPEIDFTSSMTTGQNPSKHSIADLFLYDESIRLGFIRQFGPIEDYCILALLPSYLEREGSSLIYMTEKLMEWSNDERSGFYLNEFEKIKDIIQQNTTKKILLIGVSFALLDFAEQCPFEMNNCIVMETGGMKGRRKELLREELHELLMKAFSVPQIYSEYGMTELLSQAYSSHSGIFECPTWMSVMIRELQDPMSYCEIGRSGGINIIDLANLHSCSFIATQDQGRLNHQGQFEVLGRIDNSDIRGCNLMVQ